MKSDYLYPEVADRRSPYEWEESGALDMRDRAREVARDILARHYPAYVNAEVDRRVREQHEILLPREAMQAT